MTQRYTNYPFPPYAFLPGKNPHPNRDPAGHSYNKTEPTRTEIESFRWGLDLFNFQYYWEAHEVWEGIWKENKGFREDNLFIQALIQFAACSLKRILGNEEGVEKLSSASLKKIDQLIQLGEKEHWGVDLKILRNGIEKVVSSKEFTPPEIRLRLEQK